MPDPRLSLPPTGRHRSTRPVLFACVAAVAAMGGLAYASVPLYRAFCQATGFNGTARRADHGPVDAALKQTVSVRFDTNVRGLPWTFTAEQQSQTVRLGAPAQAFFKVVNTGRTPITGRAAYNVAPEGAGEYFIKTQCFCWNDQTIAPGATVEFPVIYFVEPKFATDSSTRDIQEIVLSYTFYPAPDAKPKAG